MILKKIYRWSSDRVQISFRWDLKKSLEGFKVVFVRFLKILIWCPEKFDTGFLRVR